MSQEDVDRSALFLDDDDDDDVEEISEEAFQQLRYNLSLLQKDKLEIERMAEDVQVR